MSLAYVDPYPRTLAVAANVARTVSAVPPVPPTTPAILIADDDDDIRDAIAFNLHTSGFDTIGVSNGRTALDIALRQRPHMVILDVSMPYLDGLSVCHELHAHPDTARIPVIMVSGHAQPDDIDQGFAAGADDYLVKPFRQAELLRRVNWLLRASHR